jgi:PAS domain S-box-containing protein
MNPNKFDGLNTTLVHQLKKKIEELNEEKERYIQLFEQSNDGIILSDFNGKIFGANKKTEEITGYSGKELLGMHIGQIVPESERKKVGESYKRCLRNKNERIEAKIMKKDREIIDVDVSAKVIMLKEGSFVQAILRDITERKKTEEALKESEKKYSFIFNSSREGMAMANLKGILIDANKAFLDAHGYTREELVNKKTFMELTPKKWIKYELDIIKNQVMKRDYSNPFEKEQIKKNGEIFPVNVTIHLIKDEKGKPWRFWAIVRDITERKKAEDALRERFEIETTIAKVLSHFVYSRNINKAINSTLAEIGALRNASRAYLFLIKKDKRTMDNTHEWCTKGVKPQIRNLQNCPVNAVPWWMRKLRRNEIIHIPNIKKLPKEARAEKKILEAQNIKSLLALPVNSRKGLIGFIGFDNTKEAKSWKKEDIILLNSIAEIIGILLDTEKMMLENKEKCKKCPLAKKLKLKNEF